MANFIIRDFVSLLLFLSLFHCSRSESHTKSTIATADNYILTFNFRDPVPDRVPLFRFYGDELKFIDSLQVNDQSASHQFSKDDPIGFYKVVLGGNQAIDFIYNHENIELLISKNGSEQKVLKSAENIVLQNFFSKKESLEHKINMLKPLVYHYPVEDPFYKELENQYESLLQNEDEIYSNLNTTHPDLLATTYINFMRTPGLVKQLNQFEENQYLRKHFFDGISFDHPELLNSNAISGKIIGYLSLFRNPNIRPEEQEREFITAVDQILTRTSVNSEIHAFALSYLIKGFERFKMEKVLTYIGEKYVPEISCVNEALKHELDDKIGKYNKVAIGKKAPDFTLSTADGKLINLSNIHKDYVLLIFWASWCPHCKTSLTALKQHIEEMPDDFHNKISIIGISIDDDEKKWKESLEEDKFPWINVSELQGWDSPVALDYNIYATPTFFLLDSKKLIIEKPILVSELTEILDRL